MMVLKKNLILEMNRIIDLRERVIGVDHVSMIPVRRGLLYSGATISLSSAIVMEEGTYSIWFICSSPHYNICIYDVETLDA
jgi:hypothetical protein